VTGLVLASFADTFKTVLGVLLALAGAAPGSWRHRARQQVVEDRREPTRRGRGPPRDRLKLAGTIGSGLDP